jgi:hypothetical protein
MSGANVAAQVSGPLSGIAGVRGVSLPGVDASLRHLTRIESALAPEKILSMQGKSLRQAAGIVLLAAVRATLFKALLTAAEKA